MKKTLLIFCLLTTIFCFSQTNSRWSDLFSYNNILAIREDGDRLITATENGIFYYYPGTGEVKKLSKANGLHEVKISAFDYNAATQTGIVGYKNGSMDVITPNGIFYIVDIPLATNYSGDKKINHISINGDRAVISAGYGVSLFDVTKREFGDTAFFQTAGVFEAANAAAIRDNTVYVSTNSGVKTHEINSTFPVYNSTSWPTLVSGVSNKMSGTDVIAFSLGNQVRYGSAPNFNTLPNAFNTIQDVYVSNGNIVVAEQFQVLYYDYNGNLKYSFSPSEETTTGLVYNGNHFSGTKLNGIYNENKDSIKPDGPYNNTSYKISLLNDKIWVASGGMSSNYNLPEVKNLGYYYYDGNKWIYPDFFINNNIGFNILDVIPNPSKPSEVFFASFSQSDKKGIYKMVDNSFVKSYHLNNSPSVDYNRPYGCVFDANNDLICSLGFINGTGGSGYMYLNKTDDSFVVKNLNTPNAAQKPLVNNGILYIPIPRGGGGLIMYNYLTINNNSNVNFKLLNKGNNLPGEAFVRSIAIDKNNNLWIGASSGIRVLSNPESAILETNPKTDEIIIEENGLAEELFRDANILQIAVDSGNQKWVSIDGGGVFYISSNGEKTNNHFTKSNSPLPSDTVTDIQIDEKSGKIYFATIDGIVVYQGDAGSITSNFGDVLVYPNPVVYANYKGNVRIRGLAQKTNIRITDAAGNLVHSATANNGYYEWNLLNQRGSRVASGVYYVLMTNEDGTDKATTKIAVVN